MKQNLIKRVLFFFICIFLIVPPCHAISWGDDLNSHLLLAKGNKHKHKHKIKKKHKHTTHVQTQTITHSYYYYPGSQIYFNPGQKLYFYRVGNVWKKSVNLPPGITINPGEQVTVKLNTDKPYQHFNQHKVKYPVKKEYQFYYYPGTQVYFNPGQKLYFYRAGNVWKKSVKLPEGFAIDSAKQVSIKLDTDKPYLKFEEHKIKFPMQREFKFFPSVQVYFDPLAKTWFHLEGTSWKKYTKLPDNIVVNDTEPVVLKLDTDEPYKYYEVHKVKFKHKHKH